MTEDPARRTLNHWGRGFWLRLIGIAVLDALALYATLVLIGEGATLMLASLVVGTVFINWVYLWPRTMALRWITPGLIFMTIFVVLPIFYTVYVSLTNQKTGNLTSKEQTVEFWEAKTYVDPEAEGQLFDLYFW